MASTENLINKLFSVLSDVSHPIEGTFYLFLLAILFRWRWPSIWNNFLKNISAPVEKTLSQEGHPKPTPSFLLSDDVVSEKPTQEEPQTKSDE